MSGLAEARDLLPPRPTALGDDRTRCGRVHADRRVGVVDVGRDLLRARQLRDRHLDGDRVDAVALQAVDAAGAEGAGRRAPEADQVERAAQVHVERVIALSGEDLRPVPDAVDGGRHQRLVVRGRPGADVVRRGEEIPAERLDVGPALRVLGDLADRVGLDQVEVGVLALLGVVRDRVGVVEERARVLDLGVEPELVGDVLVAVAGVVDLDLVLHVIREAVEVRAAGGLLERHEVRDERRGVGRVRRAEGVDVGVVRRRILQRSTAPPGGRRLRRTAVPVRRRRRRRWPQAAPRRASAVVLVIARLVVLSFSYVEGSGPGCRRDRAAWIRAPRECLLRPGSPGS